jgi:predicted dehydrogenase
MRAHDQLRVVQLGLGPGGRFLHLPALDRIRGVEVVAVCDPDPVARRHLAYGGRVIAEPEEALSVECDAVVIATPPETHGALASAAIVAGRHVYLEKPMTTSLKEARGLADLADAQGVALQIGFAYRYHPLWLRARSVVTRGALRRPLAATAHFTTARDGTGWRDPVVDLASHHVDLLTWILGVNPVEIEAGPGRLRIGWPDGSELRGTYEVGAPVDRVVLVGQGGSITVDRLRATRMRGAGLRLGSAAFPNPGLLRARLGRAGWERSFEYALAGFFRAIRDGRTASPGAEAGLRAVEVGEATLRSLERGSVERL